LKPTIIVRNNAPTTRETKTRETTPHLAAVLERKLVGQTPAVNAIVPFIEMFRAGLAPEGRPAGVFLLLGPTGTGKTRTVEVLAEALHGSEKNVLKVDCGEFQMEHEVAKLLGAPPGYLGHRETAPMLTQAKINSTASEKCGLSIILFDEIEKAAPSMTRLLLGILDKATLRLGDNTTVNFERTLIFLTSNLGAKAMSRELNPGFGFGGAVETAVSSTRLDSIAKSAVRNRFAPEFLNRIDSVVTYQPLDRKSLAEILDLQLDQLQGLLDRRLGERSFTLRIPTRTREALIDRGTSVEFGARELKRLLHRNVLQPVSARFAAGEIEPDSVVTLGWDGEDFRLRVLNAKAA